MPAGLLDLSVVLLARVALQLERQDLGRLGVLRRAHAGVS
jgi:hypothetical protein